MRVNPISEATAHTQANAFRVWPKGIYDFEVLEAKERVSQTGNAMIELKVALYNADGKSRTIFDYLVESENTAYKVRHFAQAVGLMVQYEKGELRASELQGLAGKCSIRIKVDKAGKYPDKNVVEDYLPPGAALSDATKRQAPAAAPASETLDDEIPF